MKEYFTQYKEYIISGIVFIAVLVMVIIAVSPKKDNNSVSHTPDNVAKENRKEETVEVQVNRFRGSMYLETDKKEYKAGDEVKVYVKMNTQGYNINVAKAVVYYPQEQLDFLSFDNRDSVMTLKVKEDYKDGVLTVIRGKPGDTDFTDFDDGYNGVDGLLAIMVFKAKAKGRVIVELGRESRMMLDDGDGTPMDTSVNNIIINID